MQEGDEQHHFSHSERHGLKLAYQAVVDGQGKCGQMSVVMDMGHTIATQTILHNIVMSVKNGQ